VVQFLEFCSGFDAELFNQEAPHILVGNQSFSLAAAPA
jgi:hypothetical protein